jgi:hypothetical protein
MHTFVLCFPRECYGGELFYEKIRPDERRGRKGEEMRNAKGPLGRLRAGEERGGEGKSLSRRVYIYAYIHTDLNPYMHVPH